jgi:hypothetical protein
MEGCHGGDAEAAGSEGNASEGTRAQPVCADFAPGHQAIAGSGRNQVMVSPEEHSAHMRRESEPHDRLQPGRVAVLLYGVSRRGRSNGEGGRRFTLAW